MRCEGLEAKVNALTKNVEMKEKAMALLRAQSTAADRLAFKVVKFVIDNNDSPLADLTEEEYHEMNRAAAVNT